MIGISLIIKDDSEAHYLKALLRSLGKKSKDTYVTITNEPADEIRAICDKRKAHYNFFKWTNNFAEARQYGFDNLPEKYDYIFTCDADDIIEGKVDNIDMGDADTCYITYITRRDKEYGDTIVNVPRLTKRGTGHWVRPIHEVWKADTANFIIDGGKNVKCIHTKTDIEAGEKRNLDMLLGIEHKTDEDRRYIASSYIVMNKLDEALKYLEEIKDDFGFYYDVLVTISNIYKYKKKFKEGIPFLDKLLKTYGEYSDPYFVKGEYLIVMKDYPQALETYLEGFKHPKMGQIMTASSHNVAINPLGKVAFLYETLGMHDKAVWCVEVLKKISPDTNKVKELERLINGNG
jgi:hypothetical protein